MLDEFLYGIETFKSGDGFVINDIQPRQTLGKRNVWNKTPHRTTFLKSVLEPYSRTVDCTFYGTRQATMTKIEQVKTRLLSQSSGELVGWKSNREATSEMAVLEDFRTSSWENDSVKVTLVFFCPLGYALGATKTVPIGALLVGGNTETYPVYEVTPTTKTIEIGLGDKFIRLENVPNLEPIRIDTENRTIMQSGVNIRKYLTISSRYFGLPVGNNTLVISGGTGTVQYKERWL